MFAVGLELDILFASEQGSATMSVENISTAELTHTPYLLRDNA